MFNSYILTIFLTFLTVVIKIIEDNKGIYWLEFEKIQTITASKAW